MGEQTPPNKLVFQSNMQTASQQPKDYFAEQNQERAKKAAKLSKARKRLIIIIGIVVLLVVIVAIIIIFAVIKPQHSGPVVSDDAGQGDSSTVVSGGNSQLAGVDKLNQQVTEVFAPTYSVDANGNVVVNGDMAAAEATFEAALANPANENRISTIYLTQIVFYSSLGDNQRVVEIVPNVKPDDLNISEKVKFYNLAYLAYAALGDKNQAAHYYNLTREAANKVEGIGDRL